MEFRPKELVEWNQEYWRAIIAIDTERTGPSPKTHYMNALGFSVILIRDIRSDGDSFDPAKDIVVKEKGLLILEPPTPSHTFDHETKTTFWDKPENARLLVQWSSKGGDVKETMIEFKYTLIALFREYPRHAVVVDCAADVLWIDHYLCMYGNSNPLHVFEDKYEGGPVITEDVYRGFLGIEDLWGLGTKIDQLTGVIPTADGTPHDPSYDATIIGLRYALYLGLLKKSIVTGN